MNLIKRHIYLILFLTFPSILYAQPDTLWSRLYGGDSPDGFFHMQKTADNGFIMTGLTESFGAASSDYWVMKANENGDSIWSYIFKEQEAVKAFKSIEKGYGKILKDINTKLKF